MARVKPIYKKAEIYISRLKNVLYEIYGEKLISAVIFGSYVKGDFSMNSDIDLLLVVENDEENPRKRLYNFYEIIDKLSFNMQWIISPIILTLEEAEKFSPLYLEIFENHEVLYDKGFFAKLCTKLQDYIRQGKIAKKSFRGYNYWWIKDEKEISI